MSLDYSQALDAALRFRGLGYNPLPSRMDKKAPTLASFAEFWEHPLPDSAFSHWRTTNIQIMTGVRWRLCVIDCDGEQAHTVWREMKNAMGFEGPMPTWIAKTGGGGWHYYFSLPPWLDEFPGRRLWGVWDTWAGKKHTGDWELHKEVRMLGDGQLVVAPPSIHVKSGEPYHWLKGRSPDEYEFPMLAPDWLLTLPAIVNPETRETLTSPRMLIPCRAPIRPAGAFLDRQVVLDAITNKIALARGWGLRVVGSRANAKGWFTCHAIDRDDTTPSASIHEGSGVYFEQRESRKLPFFDLAVALGAYRTWTEAKDDLGARYCGPRRASQAS